MQKMLSKNAVDLYMYVCINVCQLTANLAD